MLQRYSALTKSSRNVYAPPEEQVQDAINEVVKTRRDEIDWVLTDKTHRAGSDISPEALKARLTERYFTDFGNAG